MYFNCTGHWTDKRPRQRELRGKLLLHVFLLFLVITPDDPVLVLTRLVQELGSCNVTHQHKPLA